MCGSDAAAGPVCGRVPAASTHVLIACDILSAAGPDALSLYAKDRTRAFANQDFAPTADFVADRDVGFDAARMGRAISAAARSLDQCPAHHLAETTFGDAIYANMIMLGFAWQHGQVPVSSLALYRAIRLNGVQADANLQAFELGRRVAHDPAAAFPPRPDPLNQETQALDELIARRVQDLTAYQNAAYGQRYAQVLARLAATKVADSLTRAVAINLYKLMAYKDEYEVARLYADGRFAMAREGVHSGGKTKVWLAPPILGAKDDHGHPRKIAFGGWMLRFGFPVLARLKGLRGTGLDLFGYSAERQMERRLISDYLTDLERMLAELTDARADLALAITSLPLSIRGFGHVKEAAAVKAAAERLRLWAAWDAR